MRARAETVRQRGGAAEAWLDDLRRVLRGEPQRVADVRVGVFYTAARLFARGVHVLGGIRVRDGAAMRRREHELFLRAMADAGDRDVARAVMRFATLLRSHIDKENGILLPLAEQVLSDEEQQQLRRAVEAVERELTGPDHQARLLAELGRLEAACLR